MARALYWGVPPKLEQASVVVESNLHKDKKAGALMRQMTKPRAHKDGSTTWWDRDDADKLIRLGEYCMQDVRVERSVGRRLKPMPPDERALWLPPTHERPGAQGRHRAVKAMQRVIDNELRTGRVGVGAASPTI